MEPADCYAVIMAGGSGTRFWPASRQSLPKHLLSIFGKETILQATLRRIAPLFPPERILVVTAANHACELTRQLPEVPKENIIVEPVGRNTAPCIALAALHIGKRAPGATMVAMPADQQITGEEDFRQALLAACELAGIGRHLITLGIVPTSPETGYGYIEKGPEQTEIRGHKAYLVESFREKPAYPQALEYLAAGCYLWNSGIFIWRIDAILKALKRFLPELYHVLDHTAGYLGTAEEGLRLQEAYGRISPISIDYGIMEKADNVLVVPGNFGWLDVGSWDAFYEISAKDEHNNALKVKDGVILNTNNCLVVNPDKLVALVDVDDLIVVETNDVLLICRRGQSQAVRDVVIELTTKEKREYL